MDHTTPASTPRVLRRPQVEALTGLRGGSLDRELRAGGFPRPFKLSNGPRSRAIGWDSREIAAWIDERKQLGRAA